MVDAGIYRGRDAILAMWREIRDHLSGFTMEAEDVEDLGDKILVAVRREGG